MQYYQQKDEKLVCLLCSHYCHLSSNQIGICGVNKNTGKEIECLAFGYLAALNIDPVEKKPLFHFLPNSRTLSLGTVGCNFHCSFCQNWSMSQEHTINHDHYFNPEEIVQTALKYKCDSISYTYNEPTIFYPFAKKIALEGKKKGLKNIFVSNGYQSSEVINDMKEFIDACNIDLKTFNPHYYKAMGGELEVVLTNLKHIIACDIWLEITTLLIPTKNDSKEELKAMALFIKNELGENVPWHLNAFHPNYKEKNLPRTSLESLREAYRIARDVGLNYVYIGNMSNVNSTECKKCQTLLLKREHFGVLENNLVQGHCPICSKKLEGVFHEN